VAIADSDGDYSETEAGARDIPRDQHSLIDAATGDLPMPHEPKSRKTLPQPPPMPSVPPQLAPPPNHVKQKTASPAPAPSPGGTPIPSAPSIKLKLSGLGSKSSLSGTPPPSQAAISVMPSFRKGIPGVADNFSCVANRGTLCLTRQQASNTDYGPAQARIGSARPAAKNATGRDRRLLQGQGRRANALCDVSELSGAVPSELHRGRPCVAGAKGASNQMQPGRA
jgi:hypothetical protein